MIDIIILTIIIVVLFAIFIIGTLKEFSRMSNTEFKDSNEKRSKFK
jgi:hypothetical protein